MDHISLCATIVVPTEIITVHFSTPCHIPILMPVKDNAKDTQPVWTVARKNKYGQNHLKTKLKIYIPLGKTAELL